MKRKIHLILKAFLFTILLLPLIAWIIWLCYPKKKLVVAIVDKTELSHNGQERISLNWVLNYEKYTKTSTHLYRSGEDYYGFDPLKNGQYRLKGLENFSDAQLDELSSLCDVVDFTDTYGIYSDDWGWQVAATERSQEIYGGMSTQDISFLEKMKSKHKLIFAEFNDIASPTKPDIREKFERLFAVHWSGWTTRYFDNLDTLSNKELPKWLIRNYREQHNGRWPFHRDGIAFVSQNDQVEILESQTDLITPIPIIHTFEYGQRVLGLPHLMKYPYWIDILFYNDSINHAIAAYEISPTAKGAALLQQNNIPAKFPAVIMHNGKDYKFYYFCGDYSDNPITYATSYFKGVPAISWLFYDKSDLSERRSFFWLYYRPMMTKILSDYYEEISGKRKKF